jgi:DNA-binding NarL/FixJ family response regulator
MKAKPPSKRGRMTSAVSFIPRISSVIEITPTILSGSAAATYNSRLNIDVHRYIILGAMAVHAPHRDNVLTPKEIQIGILVRCCLRNRDIAESLGISEQDVKNRLRGIFDKVGVWSRVELAMHVVEHPERWQTRTG